MLSKFEKFILTIKICKENRLILDPIKTAQSAWFCWKRPTNQSLTSAVDIAFTPIALRHGGKPEERELIVFVPTAGDPSPIATVPTLNFLCRPSICDQGCNLFGQTWPGLRKEPDYKLKEMKLRIEIITETTIETKMLWQLWWLHWLVWE